MTEDTGDWGPPAAGGRRFRRLRRLLATVTLVGLAVVVAGTTTAYLLIEQAEASLTRVTVEERETPTRTSQARHFLVVGSDSREGLDPEQRSQLTLGSFEGQRADTIIYVAVTADRNHISLVSLPRDLLVVDDGRNRKLADTFAGGPDNLIRVIRNNFGLPVNHYGEVTLGGFIDVVDTLGGVRICLDEPLRDSKSGADFEAGCQQLDPVEALAYVRSRQGPRGDVERVERQQTFIRAVIGELVSARVLVDVPRLSRLIDDVAGSVTTDEDLSIAEMRDLAAEVRQVARDGFPMTAVPAYPRRIDGIWYLVAYEPGTQALLRDLRAGRPIADRGDRDQREDTTVAIWSGGRGSPTTIVFETLFYAGFTAGGAGRGPEELDAGVTTTVYRLPGAEQQAEWVAATLGAPVQPLPPGVTAPEGANVVVAVGDDAVGTR